MTGKTPENASPTDHLLIDITNRGRQYGGIESRDGCANLPSRLQGGCYWRYNWARGDLNNWPVEVRNITCPDQLKSISGCDAGNTESKIKHRSAPMLAM